MSVHSPSEITALAAQAAANEFLNDRLPDRFTADSPERISGREVWRVPVILAYPFVGSVGRVGEVVINAETEQVVSFTPLDEMKRAAQELYEAHRAEIEAPFS